MKLVVTGTLTEFDDWIKARPADNYEWLERPDQLYEATEIILATRYWSNRTYIVYNQEVVAAVRRVPVTTDPWPIT